MIKEKHGGIKVSMYMNNLMADCGSEESIKILCSTFLVYALGESYLPFYHSRKWNMLR